MSQAWITKDGPSGGECRVTICVTPGLPSMFPVVMYAECGMGQAWVTKDGLSVDKCRVTEWVRPGLPRMVLVVMIVK